VQSNRPLPASHMIELWLLSYMRFNIGIMYKSPYKLFPYSEIPAVSVTLIYNSLSICPPHSFMDHPTCNHITLHCCTQIKLLCQFSRFPLINHQVPIITRLVCFPARRRSTYGIGRRHASPGLTRVNPSI